MPTDAQHTFAIIAYKESPYLETCIESLKAQTIASNLILCTATPSDFLTQVARRHDIAMHVNNHHQGIGPDWDFAIACAKTNFVTLAHQDDVYYPLYTETCLAATDANGNSLITFTDYEEIVGTKTRKYSLNLIIKKLLLHLWFCLRPALSSHFARKNMLALGSPLCCPSVMFDRQALQSFKFSRSLKINLDWEAWLELATYPGKFTWVRKILMAHRIHEESETSHGIRDHVRQQEDIIMFNKIYPAQIATIMSRLYSLSCRSNQISRKTK
ncbi:MAG: glycosyltransferase family 2 protein [Deltaproteobacteria bacterium]|nr:glycosyltransferase family 2 protein [Deltaproteobacteria bacterium]